jgi:hypothetical protein
VPVLPGKFPVAFLEIKVASSPLFAPFLFFPFSFFVVDYVA